ncbi:efflux RND transporter periplasmic adaptor subunit [Halanaerobium congolense]|jgi:multidrug efflux pump subunit AcrA (membrane-fusion protein)|uniref:RND family efflux transporter MFP subunit n=1 Tax=Halanaerobium congolense TaxID=54121 RepID=A0A318ECR7_9FIRM|nr:efflux RND transporter periplasmic adaptor subunit [Halanaerobium congolense]PXV67267.1 RND family efflux transporter MFP subunit [Halanaerobium congolense]TDS34634.1 RND family efflux transporter MFP subunit [Halanaerobium congolense]SDH71398.1 RND family efflux transporter, MFP subunit [Halanaerobium congolense]
MNKKTKMALTILLIIAIGAGALIFIRELKNREPQVAKEEDLGAAVETAEVQKGDFEIIYNYSGTAEYAGKRKISSQIGGEIINIYVREGQKVEKGDLLARIDDQELKNNLSSAETAVREAEIALKKAELAKDISRNNLAESKAAIKEAESNYSQWQSDYERDKKLYQKNAIAKAKFEQTKTQFQKAAAQLERVQATLSSAKKSVEIAGLDVETTVERLKKSRNELENARLKFKDTEIRSPISAEIVNEFAEVGEVTAAGQPLFEIAKSDRVEIKIQVGMSDLNQLKIGTKALISSPALEQKEFKAVISKIGSTADSKSRTTEVTLKLKENINLKDGAFVSAALIAEGLTDVLIVPEKAIFNYQAASHVYLIKDGRAVRQKIETTVTNGYQTVVTSFLSEGDQIAVTNLNDLQDKTKVYLSEQENGDD